ncbi:MAG: cytochrome c biogenesis protein CcsA [Fimbriimonas ginsengisoli]|uniref:Cytochrome c biogenesis protein CcsA n=1 Tax=Fimbriimonas ginsengisoli TaxID=1005039 RepID=A0A931LW85_FIMGI|nr:cytochrome c biogenesis protein CcsA [Fimbriimonas ginsengisoli]
MNFPGIAGWPDAPGWAIFVGQLGRALVIGSVGAYLLAVFAWLIQARRPSLEKWGKIAFWAGSLALWGTIVCLGALFVGEQFEFNYVRNGIQAGLEIKYRIAAIWAHQEGSFLLWACTSALFGVLAAPKTGICRRWFTIGYSTFLASIGGILAYETPFKLDPLIHGRILLPPNGAGLTPALQNYWVVIHPPTIFMGFGSLTVLFCWALAALLTPGARDWVKGVRPWALVSLAVLGLGLCMGGFWAYETLGWGGFWAWDPVENVSFVPWMFVATLVHGIIVQTARGSWVRANLLLGGLPFLAFVYGTFLTRSGMYADVSVHSFAQMNSVALKILIGFLGLAMLGFLGIWAWRSSSLARGGPIPPKAKGPNREAFYRLGTVVLAGIGVATAIGMSVPLIMALGGQKAKVVEERLYHQVLGWFVVPMLILMAVAPFVSWRGLPWRELGARILNAFSFAVLVAGASLFVARSPSWGVGLAGDERVNFAFGTTIPTVVWIGILLFLCAFTALANLQRLAEHWRKSKMGVGGFVSHLGVATVLAGLALSRGFERKETVVLQEDAPAQALGYLISYRSRTADDMTDRDNKVIFDVAGPSGGFEARPGLYYTGVEEGQPSPMVWPHIERGLSHDMYFTLHPPQFDLWEQPIQLKPGQTINQDGITATFEHLTMKGQPGQMGTQFGALMKFKTQRGAFETQPTLEITPKGLHPHLARIDQDLIVSLQAVDPATRSATVQVHFAKPLYPVDLFYKPMTILVWLGAGILTFGGLLTAAYRRPARAKAADAAKEAA